MKQQIFNCIIIEYRHVTPSQSFRIRVWLDALTSTFGPILPLSVGVRPKWLRRIKQKLHDWPMRMRHCWKALDELYRMMPFSHQSKILLTLNCLNYSPLPHSLRPTQRVDVVTYAPAEIRSLIQNLGETLAFEKRHMAYFDVIRSGLLFEPIFKTSSVKIWNCETISTPIGNTQSGRTGLLGRTACNGRSDA